MQLIIFSLSLEMVLHANPMAHYGLQLAKAAVPLYIQVMQALGMQAHFLDLMQDMVLRANPMAHNGLRLVGVQITLHIRVME